MAILSSLVNTSLAKLGNLDSPKVHEIKPENRLTDAQFFQLCCNHPDLQIERTADGTLIVSTPIGFDDGVIEGDVIGEIGNWAVLDRTGKSIGPSTCYKLPDNSIHAASTAWIILEKIEALTPKERQRLAPLVPDFVIDVRSNSDRIARLKKKMKEVWIKNGVRLAWLIDPVDKKAYIYRKDGSMDTIPSFDHVLSGEDVCVGLKLDLRKLTP